MRWSFAVELSKAESKVVKRLQRNGRFFAFLRAIRGELFDEAFQSELEAAGYKTPRGQPPLPPAMLAMVTLLQAYTQTSDGDAVVCAELDARWKLVLGTLGQDEAPFGQGSLPRFRERMIAHDLDRKLVDRTVELAKKSGGFGWQALRAAFDSSPLLGAGRVEDTWNLIGRAMRHVVEAVSHVTSVPADEVAAQAGLTVLGDKSVKVALDIDWDDPHERRRGLQRLVDEAERLRGWTVAHAGEKAHRPPLDQALSDLDRVLDQDLEPDPDGGGKRIKQGTAPDRMPSLGDREMRHGRKTKARKFHGYKRHIARLLGTRMIAGAVVLPANRPEQWAAAALLRDVERHGNVSELLIDRGYLGAPEVGELERTGRRVRCKPWPSRHRGHFGKEDFAIDLANSEVRCPAGHVAVARGPMRQARFAKHCRRCPLRDKCTTSRTGRTVALHPQEPLLVRLRAERRDPAARAELRKRVDVEHALARVVQIQGHRARYKGERKNTLDTRRAAAVANLMGLRRLREGMAVSGSVL
jgi:hypothetical protein